MYERLKQKEAELIMKMKDAEAMAMRLEQYKQVSDIRWSVQ